MRNKISHLKLYFKKLLHALLSLLWVFIQTFITVYKVTMKYTKFFIHVDENLL